jgi:hypothetical protein
VHHSYQVLLGLAVQLLDRTQWCCACDVYLMRASRTKRVLYDKQSARGDALLHTVVKLLRGRYTDATHCAVTGVLSAFR